MNQSVIALLVVCVLAILALPRTLAMLPLLIGACWMALGQQVTVGPLHFSFIRILLAAGLLRVLVRWERPAGGFSKIDGLLLLWGTWYIVSSIFHQDPREVFIENAGKVYNSLGIYFLTRAICRTDSDIKSLFRMIAFVLAPVALEMVYEQITGKNMFAGLGIGLTSNAVAARVGRFRAQGPFLHPILAGTVAAGCIPLMASIWRAYPFAARLGAVSCAAMIIASASSGPILSMLVGIGALIFWRWRQYTRHLQWAAVAFYIVLEIVMKPPAYFIISRIDLTGGSTGWHRAELIRSTIEHFGEWWRYGTDYTRHWMPSGVPYNEDHTDITSQYIFYGVTGGLLLMLLFMLAGIMAFRYVGRLAISEQESYSTDPWFAWTLGCSLFSHATSCISVAYFDQSFLFLFVNLAAIASLYQYARSGEGSAEYTQDETQSFEVVDSVPTYAGHGIPSWEREQA